MDTEDDLGFGAQNAHVFVTPTREALMPNASQRGGRGAVVSNRQPPQPAHHVTSVIAPPSKPVSASRTAIDPFNQPMLRFSSWPVFGEADTNNPISPTSSPGALLDRMPAPQATHFSGLDRGVPFGHFMVPRVNSYSIPKTPRRDLTSLNGLSHQCPAGHGCGFGRGPAWNLPEQRVFTPEPPPVVARQVSWQRFQPQQHPVARQASWHGSTLEPPQIERQVSWHTCQPEPRLHSQQASRFLPVEHCSPHTGQQRPEMQPSLSLPPHHIQPPAWTREGMNLLQQRAFPPESPPAVARQLSWQRCQPHQNAVVRQASCHGSTPEPLRVEKLESWHGYQPEPVPVAEQASQHGLLRAEHCSESPQPSEQRRDTRASLSLPPHQIQPPAWTREGMLLDMPVDRGTSFVREADSCGQSASSSPKRPIPMRHHIQQQFAFPEYPETGRSAVPPPILILPDLPPAGCSNSVRRLDFSDSSDVVIPTGSLRKQPKPKYWPALDYAGMSVMELKHEIQSRGLDCLFCFSREDLVARLVESDQAPPG